MRILGIDPGIGRTGWGVIEVQSAKCKVQNYGCIETSKNLVLEKRLVVLHQQLKSIIKNEEPVEIAVEELFFSTNAKTAMVVGQARGVILLTAALLKLSVSEYKPSHVKLAVTGVGNAEKKQIEKMTMLLLGIKKRPVFDDTTDALAVALTHAFSLKMKNAAKY